MMILFKTHTQKNFNLNLAAVVWVGKKHEKKKFKYPEFKKQNKTKKFLPFSCFVILTWNLKNLTSFEVSEFFFCLFVWSETKSNDLGLVIDYYRWDFFFCFLAFAIIIIIIVVIVVIIMHRVLNRLIFVVVRKKLSMFWKLPGVCVCVTQLGV